MFQKGDQIICINDSYPNPLILTEFDYWPHKGQEYTVRRYEETPVGSRVLLEGIKNTPIYIPMLMAKAEPGYDAKRFRKKSEMTEEELHEVREQAIEQI